MKKISLAKIFTPVIALLSLALVGCGSGANNDEGVSFTMFGFYANIEGSTGLTGSGMSLTEATGADFFSPRAFIGLQNNLAGQFIRLNRVNYSYNIPGAAAQPPNTSAALPGVIGPAAGATSPSNTTLPQGIGANDKIGPVGFFEIALVPKDTRDWMRANRGFLPAAPFQLEVSVSSSGRTSSGDFLESNEDTILVVVSD